MTPLKPVVSAAMLAYGYDAASQTLAIRFGPGKVAHFAGVPADTAAAFDAAESKGRAYHSLIKGKFVATSVMDEPEPATTEGA